jgi:hypothetical protein
MTARAKPDASFPVCQPGGHSKQYQWKDTRPSPEIHLKFLLLFAHPLYDPLIFPSRFLVRGFGRYSDRFIMTY